MRYCRCKRHNRYRKQALITARSTRTYSTKATSRQVAEIEELRANNPGYDKPFAIFDEPIKLPNGAVQFAKGIPNTPEDIDRLYAKAIGTCEEER